MNKFYEGQLDTLIQISKLIELAQKNENKILEAVYRLRLMRFNKKINKEELLEIKVLLKNTSYEYLIDYLFDIEKYQYIDFINSQNYDNEIELLFDNRTKEEYQISCIISTYNEGPNLFSCIERLLNQTAYIESKLEIIIIDSNSETNEYLHFNNYKFDHVVYFRTTKTEKLSRAWNRGVNKSRGKFLTFTAPSQYFSNNAFSKMASHFEDDVVMVQSDVGNLTNFDSNSPNFERITFRKKNSFDQVNPLLFMNYLAFDCAIVRRSIFFEVGGFDENFTAAAENKFQLAVLSKGKLFQTGELHGGTRVNDDVGERLTVHPKIELEHFVATTLFANYQYMQKCAVFDDYLKTKDNFSMNFYLLNNILSYEICYQEGNKFYKYSNFDLAISFLSKLIEEDKAFETYLTDLQILSLRSNTDLLIYNLKKSNLISSKLYILFLVLIRFVLQFFKIKLLKKCIYNQLIPFSRLRILNKIIYKISSIFINHKRLKTDMYGNYIW